MPQTAAGILLYKWENDELKVFLVHPGGPFFKKKDKGWWGIPKGLPKNKEEELLVTAKREFAEETGFSLQGEFIPLDSAKMKSGKIVHAWAVENDLPENWELKCNTFETEWPPKSGKYQTFPEVDEGRFFGLKEAREYIGEAQIIFLDRLEAITQPKRK
ncbi:MAG: NUDIX domain-containing protein [Bacteroidia bacterium]